MACFEALPRVAFLPGLLLIFLPLMGTHATLAQPARIVTVCGRDDSAGGLNFATAVSQGGTVTIRCPAGQDAIELTRTYALASNLAISGEGSVTLRGPNSGPMFTTSQTLRLSGLTLSNPAAVSGSIVSGDMASVTLEGVQVEQSTSAFVVRTLRAERSRFAGNGNSTAEASGGAVINAETIDLIGCDFTENGDHPVAGGAWPTPDRIALSRRVSIDGTKFSGNRASLLLIDARVSIRTSQFVANGLPPGSRETWGCCGGALTLVRSDAQIFDSEFSGNDSLGFGGAIHAVGSRLTVARSSFVRNAARVGGALMSWGRPPRNNIWSANDWIDLPRLVLNHVTFDGNTASEFGGALAFAGAIGGNGLVFRRNEAHSAGGAIASWHAAEMPEPFGGVLQALVDNTKPEPADRVALAQSIFTENRSSGSGAALSAADADAALGNTIVARNSVVAGAAVVGTRLRLVNDVVADNSGTGVAGPPGASIVLGNTVLLRNSNGNCAFAAPVIVGPNMQSPSNVCGDKVASVDPGLDGSYAPSIVSAARGTGDYGLCVSDPEVMGVDLYGTSRIALAQSCAVGAIERSRTEAVASALTFGSKNGRGPWLWWILALLLLAGLVAGALIQRRRWHRSGNSAAHPTC